MNEERDALIEELNLQADMEELYREAVNAANDEIDLQSGG
jgi:hypothetical protein